MKGGAHPSPFAALSFSNAIKVTIYCWVERESFPVVAWRSPGSNTLFTATFCTITEPLLPFDHGVFLAAIPDGTRLHDFLPLIELWKLLTDRLSCLKEWPLSIGDQSFKGQSDLPCSLMMYPGTRGYSADSRSRGVCSGTALFAIISVSCMVKS